MTLKDEHRRLADAAMQVEAYKLYGKRVRIPKEIEKASFQASIEDDMRARPGSPKGWYNGTADAVNSEIIQESRKAVKAVFNEYKVSALDGTLGLGLASAVAFAPTNQGVEAAQPTEVSRRTMLATGAAAAGVAILTPSQAAALNTGYIESVRSGISKYARSRAPEVVRSVGAGIRG